MIKLEHIAEGFVNYALSFKRSPDNEIEVKATHRLSVCAECEYKKDLWCNDCGCYLPSKARSKSECPKNKW